jgi:hypothetical protein
MFSFYSYRYILTNNEVSDSSQNYTTKNFYNLMWILANGYKKITWKTKVLQPEDGQIGGNMYSNENEYVIINIRKYISYCVYGNLALY